MKQAPRSTPSDDFDLMDSKCASSRLSELQDTLTALTVSLRDVDACLPLYVARGAGEAVERISAQRLTLQAEKSATESALMLVEKVVAIHAQMNTARAQLLEADRVDERTKELAKALKALDGAMSGLATAILNCFDKAKGHAGANARLPGVINRSWIFHAREAGYRSHGGAVQNAFTGMCAPISANHAAPAAVATLPGSNPEQMRVGAKCDLKRLSDSLSELLADPEATIPARLKTPVRATEAA